MDAVAAKRLPASEVPAEVVRQLRNLQRQGPRHAASARSGASSAPRRPTGKELIAEWRKKLNRSGQRRRTCRWAGRCFAKTCQQCHTLYGVGGKVGPDITGSNRANLDYLLENILDPSAVIPNDYKATVIELKNGRVITGIVRGENAVALTVVTANETLIVPRGDIDSRTPSNVSMMPDDLLKPLTETRSAA